MKSKTGQLRFALPCFFLFFLRRPLDGRSVLPTLKRMQKYSRVLSVFFAVSAVAVLGVAAFHDASATPDKFDPAIQVELTANSNVSALILLQEQADLTRAGLFRNKADKGLFVYDSLRRVAERTQGDLVQFLAQNHVHFQRFYIANMIAVEGVTPAFLRKLAERDDVARIYSDKAQQRTFPSPFLRRMDRDPQGVGANIAATGAERVWNEFHTQGEHIVVAGQDTGYDWTHPALTTSYRGNSAAGVNHNYNWHDSIHASGARGENKCGYDLDAPCDDDQHGTHTMGTMVGDDHQGNQVGMAPGAQWMGCRNMDAGNGKPSSYIECFEFFLAPYPIKGNAMTDGDPSKAPHVINNSWGCIASEGCQGDEILPVLHALRAAGIFVVVSAGNEGPGCSTIESPPAWHTAETFSVGAYNHRNGKIADFSSRGPSKRDGGVGPDITAPGVSVRSSIPGGSYGEFMWSGTSMAGPHVAGAVALLWSARPELIGQIDETTAILTAAATPKTTTENCGGVSGETVPNNTWGYGVLDIYKAVSQH